MTQEEVYLLKETRSNSITHLIQMIETVDDYKEFKRMFVKDLEELNRNVIKNDFSKYSDLILNKTYPTLFD